MVSVTLTIDDVIKSKIERLSWINWSELVREEISEDLERSAALTKFLEIVSKSKFTEKDADLLSEKVRASMHKRLKEKGLI
mgnify:CR=1 FL=1